MSGDHNDSVKRVRRFIALSGGNNVLLLMYRTLSYQIRIRCYMFVIVSFRHPL